MAALTNGNKVAPELPRKAFGLAAHDTSGLLSPFPFSRRNNGDNDVTLKILYCGICHSDLHSLKNDWKNTMYPIVPGHEIVGEVTEVGSKVNKFKLGDKVGIGCLVNSCRSCHGCTTGFENYCPVPIFTYNSVDPEDGTVTYGGYSDMIVVNQDFVIRIPEGLPLDKAAPLLCAGITVYSPMKYHRLNAPGMHLGVVGLGGLGHVAVKFGKAFGMKVTVISSSPSKEKEAIERLDADSFLVSSNAEQMKAAIFSMDGIINTVSASHSVVPLLSLLKPNGKMIMVGLPEKPLEVPAFSLIMGGKILAGSCIGGIADTQEMIDFAGKHNVTADIELISADYVNKAMERLAKADVKFRFVIDIANTLKPNI
ncbi:putative mannitol dehydrogenase [Carex littledalei]|uniref:cinnamyl-alcohol dehydrogenase n=1 Tax=Carex littledalei TaxID=544730 RepID=A0A833QFN2_9POAL|nr:putative mannitol dehydrogenase [Carex littledalei]